MEPLMAELTEATPDEQVKTGDEPEPDVADDAEDLDKTIAKDLKARADESKRLYKDKSEDWKRNVEQRLGMTRTVVAGATISDTQPQSEINPDWSLTKAKIANLFSRVPKVAGTHEAKQFGPAIPPLTKSLNYEISEKRAKLAIAMEEELNDVVNASGIGGILVGYTARYIDKEVPSVDLPTLSPQQIQFGIQQKLIPTKVMKVKSSDRTFARRISPSRLLTPADFTGSDFDDGDFVGHTGDCSWADAKNEFKLTEDDKEKVISAGSQQDLIDRSLRRESDNTHQNLKEERVYYDELFYWRSRVDPDETQLRAIWRIVWVRGIEKPVIHEAWKGQELVEETHTLIGVTIFPLQVLTLTYISDNPIPPSDTQASRPQVNDMRRSRSQMFMNRERSVPLRWYDVNRVDTTIQSQIQRGTWQGMIPTNGDGSKSIGEIARASYPSEDLAFDQQAHSDLLESWQLTGAATGAGTRGRQTKAQVESDTSGFQTAMGQQRAKVAMHFLRLCEIVTGLMVLFSDFPLLTPQERQQMEQAWDRKHITHNLVLKIRPNSTILPDPNQRIQQISNALNLTGQSGYVNPKPLIIEIMELSDIDPTEVVIDPQPKQPDEPSISFRMTGKQDLNNPAVMAMLVKHKQAPTPEEMKQAKAILRAGQSLEDEPETEGGSGNPAAPGGAGVGAAHPPAVPRPGSPVPHPHWKTQPKIAKRSRDLTA